MKLVRLKDKNSNNIINKNQLELQYPVNKVEIFYDNLDHSNWLGFTWELIAKGKTLVGIDTNDTDFNSIGKTDGSKTHNHLTAMGFDPQNGLYGYAGSDGSPAYGSTVLYNVKRNFMTNFAQSDNQPVRLGYTDGGSSLQPYLVVAYWRRTA